MTEFAIALVLFLLAHAAPARPSVRRRLTGTLGERTYLALYSVVSIALLVWVIWAAVRAPYVALWSPAPWQYVVALAAMPLALVLLGAGLAQPNPLSISFSQRSFDPQRPGIAANGACWDRSPGRRWPLETQTSRSLPCSPGDRGCRRMRRPGSARLPASSSMRCFCSAAMYGCSPSIRWPCCSLRPARRDRQRCRNGCLRRAIRPDGRIARHRAQASALAILRRPKSHRVALRPATIMG